ncbi:MAG: SPOR domain-containing protein, partial [Rhodospirillales bacterium]
QVGYFATEASASRLAGDLSGKGYAAEVLGAPDATGRTWYSVGIGDYTDRDIAEREARNFRKAENKPVRVVFLDGSQQPVTQ